MGWVTAEEVLAAKAALEAAMPGWCAPAAHAVGVSVDGDAIEWRVVNHPNVHQLPAVVLGTVLGHRSGSATYWLTQVQLEAAISMLEPAGACRAFEHPNLWAWQRVRSELAEGALPGSASVVVVFLDEELTATDGPQRQLARTIGRAPGRS